MAEMLFAGGALHVSDDTTKHVRNGHRDKQLYC